MIWSTRLGLANSHSLFFSLSLSHSPFFYALTPSFSICCSVQRCQRTRAVTLKKRQRVGHTHRTLGQCRRGFLRVCHDDRWALTTAGSQPRLARVCVLYLGGGGARGYRGTRQMPWGDALQLTSWGRPNCPMPSDLCLNGLEWLFTTHLA